MKMTITDINASLRNITGGDSSDKNVTFVYARAHVPDSRVGYISIYYEVYCNFRTGCNKGFGRESENGIWWDIIEGDDNLDFSNPRSSNPNYIVTRINGDVMLIELKEQYPRGGRVYYTPKDYLYNLNYSRDTKELDFSVRAW